MARAGRGRRGGCACALWRCRDGEASANLVSAKVVLEGSLDEMMESVVGLN
jgi:hypothetical protein